MMRVRVIANGYKTAVEYAATVNKVSYYVSVSNPEKVYTELEIRRLKK